MKINLRDYQKECIDVIINQEPGSYLVQMATGLGKTVTFAALKNYYRKMLILSHRIELVTQPKKYFPDCSYGIDQGKNHSNEKNDVVSACIQTYIKRYKKYSKQHFDIIIVDEAHHAAAKSYKEILSYYKPKHVIGFTATPNRGDDVGLRDVFSKIIYKKSLKWGIKNNFLCDIKCKKVNIGFNLSNVKSNSNDFQEKSLDEEINIEECNNAIKNTVEKFAEGQTVIFATSVKHCHNLQEIIPNSKVVDGMTKKDDRKKIIKDFTDRKFKVLINCMVFTEGTDMPLIETVIIARPTKNESLYTQMVGRGLRLYPGKEKLLLIDCVGVSNLDICTAPTLIGLDTLNVPKNKENEIEGDLFDLENVLFEQTNNPISWIKNIETVKLWSKKTKFKTHGINFLKCPTGDLVLSIPNFQVRIEKPDELGETFFNGQLMHMQEAIDLVYEYLIENHQNQRQIWDTSHINRWGKHNATEKQMFVLKQNFPEIEFGKLNKMEASQVLNHITL